MKYEKPELLANASAVDSIQQRQGQIPMKMSNAYLDLSTDQFTSEITTAAAYEADE